MNRFNSLVSVQHYDVQNLTPETKRETKHAVYNYLEHMQHCKTF